MGFGDIVSTVLTRYKADTKDQERAIKKLSGEQKKQAKEQLEALKKQNEGIDRQIERWGKAAAAVGGTIIAIKGAQVAFNAYQRDVQLRSAAAGIDIGRLQKATRGLLEEEKLLELAVAGTNTEFKLSQSQLEEVGKFMLVLRKRGHNVTEAFEEVKTALQETNIEGLHKFGIHVDAASETLEGFNGMMAAIRLENRKFSGDLEMTGDDINKTMVSAADAMRGVKVAIGDLVAQAAPALKALASAIGLVSDALDALRDDLETGGFWIRTITTGAGGPNPQFSITGGLKGHMSAFRTGAARSTERQRIAALPGMFDIPTEALLRAQMGRDLDEKGKAAGKPGDLRPFMMRAGSLLQAAGSTLNQAANAAFAAPGELGRAGLLQSGQSIAGAIGAPERSFANRLGSGFHDAFGSLKSTDAGEAKLRKELETMKMLNSETLRTQASFQLLDSTIMGVSQSFGQALSLWLTGQKSMGDALKDMLKQLALQFVSEFTMRAVMETGKGFVALADPFTAPKAAVHFKAAAVFAGGAAFAAALGHAGGAFNAPSTPGATTTGAASGARVSGGGRGGMGGGQTVIVVRDIEGDSRRRAQRTRKLLREAEQFTGKRTVHLG